MFDLEINQETKRKNHGTHHLKAWPCFFERCLDGSKPFEIRLNDRDFRVGDVIVLHEWDPARGRDRMAEGYTERDMRGTITCVICRSDLVKLGNEIIGEGYVVLGIRWYHENSITDEALLNLVKS